MTLSCPEEVGGIVSFALEARAFFGEEGICFSGEVSSCLLARPRFTGGSFSVTFFGDFSRVVRPFFGLGDLVDSLRFVSG